MTKYIDIRWEQRFQNFEKAFLSFEKSHIELKKDESNLFVRDSLIQRYEFTIELARKTLKDFLENEGFADVGSPKNVIRMAFKEGYIKNGDSWILALNTRNQTSHLYDEEMVEEIVHEIDDSYYFLIKEMYENFKKRFND